MSSEESFDQLECSRCGQFVEQILALQCNHNLCLVCAAKTINSSQQQSQQQQKVLNSIKCEICGVMTILDPSSAQVLMQMRDDQIPQQQSQQQMVDQVNEHILEDKANQRQLYSPGANINTSQQQQQFDQNYNNSDIQRGFDESNEDTILYCFSCETPCFTVENYLNGHHKNHDVGNIRKKYENLQNNVDDLRFKVKTRADLLLNDESRLTQKKRELVEIVSQAKTQIKQSFDEIMLVIEQKQAQLLQNTEDLMEEKFMEIDRCLGKVSNQTNFLQQFDAELDRLYNRSDRSAQSDIRAFNFYAENKQKILQTLSDMDSNFFTQIKDKMHCDFVLDMNSVYQHLEAVQGVKMEVMTLKGLESLTPTMMEQQLFEKAKQDRNSRRFDNFHNTSSSSKQNNTNFASNMSQLIQQQQQNSVQSQQQQQQDSVNEDQQYMQYVSDNKKPPRAGQPLNTSQSINREERKQVQFVGENNNVNVNNRSESKLGQSIVNNRNVSEQLEDLKRQIQDRPQGQKENSTLDRISALRNRFQQVNK